MLIIKGHARPCGMSKYGFKSHMVFLFSLVKTNSWVFQCKKDARMCLSINGSQCWCLWRVEYNWTIPTLFKVLTNFTLVGSMELGLSLVHKKDTWISHLKSSNNTWWWPWLKWKLLVKCLNFFSISPLILLQLWHLDLNFLEVVNIYLLHFLNIHVMF